MDKLDTEILNEIQWTFPLVAKPFDEMAKKFGISSDDVKTRLVQLKRKGVLRQLSAIFDTRKLGYTSSLVAMEIEPDKLEYVAHQINRHPGVSHNYERDHEFNLWFTLAVPPGSDLEKELGKFSKLDGIKKTRMLPTLQLFKIGVKLYEEIGVMRRYAAILRHREAGFTANGMIVWKVPEQRITEVGNKLGAFPQVSHCYERPVYPDWPYNVFSMIHCKSFDEAGEVAGQIQKQIDVDEYKILFSAKEFKKTRVEYFVENEFSLEEKIPA